MTQNIGSGDVASLPDREWKHVDVVCGHCGATNQIHEQLPEWLAEGVRWECNYCAGVNLLGGPPVAVPLDESVAALGVLECGECHATHDPAATDHEVDGNSVEFDCPACGVHNRLIAPLGERATGSTEVKS